MIRRTEFVPRQSRLATRLLRSMHAQGPSSKGLINIPPDHNDGYCAMQEIPRSVKPRRCASEPPYRVPLASHFNSQPKLIAQDCPSSPPLPCWKHNLTFNAIHREQASQKLGQQGQISHAIEISSRREQRMCKESYGLITCSET